MPPATSATARLQPQSGPGAAQQAASLPASVLDSLYSQIAILDQQAKNLSAIYLGPRWGAIGMS